MLGFPLNNKTKKTVDEEKDVQQEEMKTHSGFFPFYLKQKKKQETCFFKNIYKKLR